MQQAAREVGLTDIWFFTQKGYCIRKIQQVMGLESLDAAIVAARRQTDAAEPARQLELARKRLTAEVRNHVERPLSLYGTAPTRRASRAPHEAPGARTARLPPHPAQERSL